MATMFNTIEAMGLDGAKILQAWISKEPASEEDFEQNMSIIDALVELNDVDSVTTRTV